MKKKSVFKANLPIHGNNLFNNNNNYNIDKNTNDINKNILNTVLINKNENINSNNNYAYFSNYSNKKRATSEFKNKIFQTTNNNNLFNDKNNINNSNNINNNNIPTKNINEQKLTTVINVSPIKRNKYKPLFSNNRNISSCEMVKFPLIID